MRATKFEEVLTGLEEASLTLEKLAEMDNLTVQQTVDLGARFRLMKGTIEKLDKMISEIIKVQLNEEEGTLSGALFNATAAIVPSERLDSKLLKEERPKLYTTYLKDSESYRITYKPR